MRNCYLVGLNDLDGAQSYVQDVQAQYMNDLIKIGVAGTYIHKQAIFNMPHLEIGSKQDQVSLQKMLL